MHDFASDGGRIDGAHVRALRLRRGLSQGQLAVITGISRPHISQIESGARKCPSGLFLVRLARALRVQPDELLCGGGQPRGAVGAVREAPAAYGWAPQDAELEALVKAVDELPAADREVVKVGIEALLAVVKRRQRQDVGAEPDSSPIQDEDKGAAAGA